ncbi:MAG: hypothetical protein QM770_12050 [Tepidisphaeraceae bacterium]
MSHRLMLMAGVFVIPLAVTIFIIVRQNQANIAFAAAEQAGIRYQRPLMALLDGVAKVHADRQAGRNDRENTSKVDEAFDALVAVQSTDGDALQFTQAGLAQRKRDGVLPGDLRSKWSAAKASSDLNALGVLQSDLRTAIAHAGDTSNLILDPDLDSYYLMDAMLCAAPQTLDRLNQNPPLRARGGRRWQTRFGRGAGRGRSRGETRRSRCRPHQGRRGHLAE